MLVTVFYKMNNFCFDDIKIILEKNIDSYKNKYKKIESIIYYVTDFFHVYIYLYIFYKEIIINSKNK